MSSILLSGVSGLNANQQMLDVVGNDLANSNTTGYKAQQIQFSDVMYQTLQSGGAPTSTNGGTNPVQIGSGVQVGQVQADLQQGTLEQTGNSLDMALQGNGYFVVNDGTQNLYTRDGSFSVDSQGYLVDPATGDRVQRFGTVGNPTATTQGFQTPGSNDISIPYGAVMPGQATSNITLQGNLPASDTGPIAQVLTSAQPFLSGGVAATTSTLLNQLDDNTTPYVSGDKLLISGTTSSGTPVNDTLSVGPTTTLGDVVNAINADFPGSTASLTSNGDLVVTANATGASELSVNIADGAGNTGATDWTNHEEAVTTTGQAASSISTSIQIYDPQGTAHTLNLVLEKQADSTWTLTGSLAAGGGTMINSTVTGITFNSDGSFKGVTGAGGGLSMSVAFPNQTNPQQINFNFGSPGGFNGLTEVGGEASAAATSQNGTAAGTLTDVSIGTDGTISGVFSNGQSLALAQLAVANFANPAALSRQGSNYLTTTGNSGVPLIGAGGAGGNGTVEQGQLEDSNVDVSTEFTRLIIAQQGYEANAKALTTADQVMSDLIQMLQTT